MLISAVQLHTHTHTHTHIYSFSYSFLLRFPKGVEYSSLCFSAWLCCLTTLCSTLHPLIPSAQSLPPQPPLPLGNHKSVLCLWVCFYFTDRFYLCHILNSTCKWYHMVFVFLWLTWLSVITSKSIHILQIIHLGHYHSCHNNRNQGDHFPPFLLSPFHFLKNISLPIPTSKLLTNIVKNLTYAFF